MPTYAQLMATRASMVAGLHPAVVEPASMGFAPGLGVGAAPVSGSGSGGTLNPNVQGLNLEMTARITSATDISSTNQNEYLWGLWLEGGATPGWLAILYDTVNSAIMPVPASGFDATGAIGPVNEVFVPMNMKFTGTLILSHLVQTFGGGLAAIRALLGNKPNPSPDAISDFNTLRGVAVVGNESGTSGTAKTYTMPGGASIAPVGVSAMMSIQAGTATGFPSAEIDFPAVQPFGAYVVPATLGRREHKVAVYPVPAIGPATTYSLTHKAVSLGGATGVSIAGVLWLPPA